MRVGYPLYVADRAQYGEQHGYGIMQEVLNRTTGKVRLWPATLYGSIKRLIEADLIEESDERPAPELDDARRRYYRLTALGRRVLDEYFILTSCMRRSNVPIRHSIGERSCVKSKRIFSREPWI
jgi:DNA-binding PadR family transcriptional regulator